MKRSDPVRRYGVWVALVVGSLTASTTAESEPPPDSPARPAGLTVETLERLPTLPGDLAALPEVPVPADNPLTQKKIELGMMLYFDKRLSRDNSTSCATCHDPAKGYSDGLPRSRGFGDKELGRHSPTLLNAAYNQPQYWDGRASSLEEQAVDPIMGAAEMNMPSYEEVLRRITHAPEYEGRFLEAFGEPASIETVAKALASFERTLVTPSSPFDRYVSGDRDAMTMEAKRGLALFVGKAGCAQCHSGPNLTDNEYHNVGVAQRGPLDEDLGRFHVTQDEADRGAFKTPTLRNLSLTAPYMHDGAFWTLEEIIDLYDRGGGEAANKSELLYELALTTQEKGELVAFLGALNGRQPPLPEIYASTSRRDDRFRSIGALMKDGIHEDFTFLSFTIWHDRPLTEVKRDGIAVAADNINRLAKRLRRFKDSRIASSDPRAFAASVEGLVETAAAIRSHAATEDVDVLGDDFIALEEACSHCHAVFQEGLELQ